MKKNIVILTFGICIMILGMFIACQGPDLFNPSLSSDWKAPYWNNRGKDKDAIAEGRAWYNLYRDEVASFMTISPSAHYLDLTNFRPFYSTYAKRDKVFDGYIYYHDMQGNFVNGWKYAKGKITNAIYSKTDVILPTQASCEICIPQYVCESEEDSVRLNRLLENKSKVKKV